MNAVLHFHFSMSILHLGVYLDVMTFLMVMELYYCMKITKVYRVQEVYCKERRRKHTKCYIHKKKRKKKHLYERGTYCKDKK